MYCCASLEWTQLTWCISARTAAVCLTSAARNHVTPSRWQTRIRYLDSPGARHLHPQEIGWGVIYKEIILGISLGLLMGIMSFEHLLDMNGLFAVLI